MKSNFNSLVRTKIIDAFANKTLVSVVLISLALLSIVFYLLPVEVDCSRNHFNSICRESKSILKTLDVKDDDLKVIYLSAITNASVDTNVKQRVKTVFEQFYKYNKNIEYEIIDLSRHADALGKYPVAEKKSIVIDYKGKQSFIPFESFVSVTNEKIEVNIESVLIDEFLKIVGNDKFTIYYTNKHGEKFDSSEYSVFNVLLNNLGYTVKPLDLSTRIPTEVSTLYIVGPREDFSETEIEHLENYVRRGNSLFISFSDNLSNENSPVTCPNLKEFCSELGINIQDSIIHDQIQDTKLIGVYSDEDEEALSIEEANPIVYLPTSRVMMLSERPTNYMTTVTMRAGELSSSYPLIVKLENENTKILVSATSELFSNSYLETNRIFDTYLIQWIDNFETNTTIKPFVYNLNGTNAAEFRPALVLGIIQIMVPAFAFYFGFEISRKRVMKLKSKIMQ